MMTAIWHPEPPPAPSPRPVEPSWGLIREWTLGAQMIRLVGALPQLAEVPPLGDGRVVVLVPGWRTPGMSMGPLRRYLRRLGHDAVPWGLGWNLGRPEQDRDRMIPRVQAWAAQSERRVVLVGWSLGGVIAREVARVVPEHVAEVITYGTPVVGGPTYTAAAGRWGEAECRRLADGLAELDRTTPIQTPITAVFSRQDQMVSWAACIDKTSPDVRHVEVDSTHVGMGFDPSVWRAIASRLAVVGDGPPAGS